MTRIHTFCLTAVVLGTMSVVPAFAAEQGHVDHGHDAHTPGDQAANQSTTRIGDPYPLATDPVTGGSLLDAQDPIVLLHEGRELRFVDAKSVEKFKAEPAKYLAKVDQQIIESQMPYYPMTTCPISGDKLTGGGGEMGAPVDYVYGNRLIRFCCKGCKGDFLKDPAPTLEKLDAAVIAQQKAQYPLKACPVSGQKLGSMGEPQDVVIANRLVRLCCAGCKDKLMANPAKVLAEVDAAWEKSDAKLGSPDDHAGHTH